MKGLSPKLEMNKPKAAAPPATAVKRKAESSSSCVSTSESKEARVHEAPFSSATSAAVSAAEAVLSRASSSQSLTQEDSAAASPSTPSTDFQTASLVLSRQSDEAVINEWLVELTQDPNPCRFCGKQKHTTSVFQCLVVLLCTRCGGSQHWRSTCSQPFFDLNLSISGRCRACWGRVKTNHQHTHTAHKELFLLGWHFKVSPVANAPFLFDSPSALLAALAPIRNNDSQLLRYMVGVVRVLKERRQDRQQQPRQHF